MVSNRVDIRNNILVVFKFYRINIICTKYLEQVYTKTIISHDDMLWAKWPNKELSKAPVDL